MTCFPFRFGWHPRRAPAVRAGPALRLPHHEQSRGSSCHDGRLHHAARIVIVSLLFGARDVACLERGSYLFILKLLRCISYHAIWVGQLDLFRWRCGDTSLTRQRSGETLDHSLKFMLSMCNTFSGNKYKFVIFPVVISRLMTDGYGSRTLSSFIRPDQKYCRKLMEKLDKPNID